MSQGVHFRNPACKVLYHLADLNDDSGNSRTLTDYGTVTYPVNSYGSCGSSALFASSGQCLNTTAAAVTLSGAWTHRFTLKLTDQIGAATDYMCLAFVADSTNYYYIYYANLTSPGKCLYIDATASVSVTIELSVGVPYHVVATHDGSGNYSLYLNGYLVASGATTLKTFGFSHFRISNNTTNRNIHGNVDESMWLSVCWTPQQVMRDYAWCKGVL